MNGHEYTPSPEKLPETQSASSGGPPAPPPPPPKLTARDLLDPGDDKTIYVPGYIEGRELAQAMKLKPFKVVADLMELKLFKHVEELIDFETAAKIVQKHGFQVKGFLIIAVHMLATGPCLSDFRRQMSPIFALIPCPITCNISPDEKVRSHMLSSGAVQPVRPVLPV